MKKIFYYFLVFPFLLMVFITSCKKTEKGAPNIPVVPPPVVPPNNSPEAFDINSIADTYDNLAPFTFYTKWGSYNVHDPSILKIGEYYYCYSTDVGFGIDVRSGIQIRKSKDLVEWTFVGWVFNALPAKGSSYISQFGGTPFNSLWAPYIMKVGNEFRLYYSLSSAVSRLSVIGLATSNSPEGPWIEKDIVVSSRNENTIQTNAIDPTVAVTNSGEHWLYYGSAYDGIYFLKLDPSTGLALSNGDKGVRIAQRGFTGNVINGNIEGPEIIFNAALKKYFLFISYDWLQTKYNVRVGRSDQPQGPFLDFNGIDINTVQDHDPMILAPYKFEGHSGWQGTGHCAVFKDDHDQFFLAHQARPVVNSYFMDLHVRKIFWTDDGWPVVSPERFAWEDNSVVAVDSLAGRWEHLVLNYHVVPGFSNEQLYPDLQISNSFTLDASGNISGNTNGAWIYKAPWLELNWNNGEIDKVLVQSGRDWEKKKTTLIYSGLNKNGIAIWGKKL